MSRLLDAAGVLVDESYDQTIRWQQGTRLHHLFEEQCDRLRSEGRSGHLAVDTGDEALTYSRLDERANQLARHLIASGARPGMVIGLLLDDPLQSYIALLAVLKVHAAYLPLDPGFPPDRCAFILQDARVAMVVTLSHLRENLAGQDLVTIDLDVVGELISAQPEDRLTEAEQGVPTDELCYVVYTSGSTGRPKGVAVDHASICNFVRVAAEVYGVRSDDRVYQGMTIAFDFSVEEIWVPLVAGSTLVPKPAGSALVGADLQNFLQAARVTALCCVPPLLATLEPDLPWLRFLLVSGEACPQDLIRRWSRPGRRFLNVYGPTETTVTATWAVVDPYRPVTIGVPLPTYSVVILDPDPATVVALQPGELGEIAIAGVGLARGYLNQPELTAAVFVPDTLGLPNNPSARLYRTGDLGRIGPEGAIEYHGRLDSQVKIRGYRVELTEIESALLEAPGIAQAVVSTQVGPARMVELVAYYTRRGHQSADRHNIYQHLRTRLPPYMVPAYLEELPHLPRLPSGKTDRNALPPPRAPRCTGTETAHVPPANARERLLAEALGDVLGVEGPSVESHFFDELGADSLLMARFCSSVRGCDGFGSLSMRDVYLHPTIRRLAATVATPSTSAPEPPRETTDPAASPEGTPANGRAWIPYLTCGAAQFGCLVIWISLWGAVLAAGVQWIEAAPGHVDAWKRSTAFTLGFFAGFSLLPVAAKWILVGRFRYERFPVWGRTYLRFWIVKALIRTSPMVLFVGSPLYVLYLRALGATIGRRALILSRSVPVCVDLLTVGNDAVIHKQASFMCYRARAGRIETGPIVLGDDVVVGEEAVLDIHTSMGAGARLGHASTLNAGQAVPPATFFAGSPGQPAESNEEPVIPARCGPGRRVAFTLVQLTFGLVVSGPLFLTAIIGVAANVPLVTELLSADHNRFTSFAFYHDVTLVSLTVFVAAVLMQMTVTLSTAYLLRPLLRPERIYPLYGLSYWALRAMGRTTNVPFFTWLFGDSSAIVYYLRALGYRLTPVQQTGSNFGLTVKHDVPYLCAVGTGTMASDTLSFANARFSSTSFRVSSVRVGSRNFLGNVIVYPPSGRTGDNCLLATKVMVPTAGAVREGIGLLGSPPFPIPRSVSRDRSLPSWEGQELRSRLHAKNAHNVVTMGLFLLVRWLFLWAVCVGGVVAGDASRWFGPGGLVATVALAVPISVAFWVGIDRLCTAYAAVQPRLCSIYDRAYWRHERFWKVPGRRYWVMFNGTPFKTLIWRLLGVRTGRRCFDDGAFLSERALVSLGDECTLNSGCDIQGHSLEEGAFKSDRIVIGAGCTVGTNAFVHYGVAMAPGAVLEPNSFLMKGEEVPAGATWCGNPARVVPAHRSLLDRLRLRPADAAGCPTGVGLSFFSLRACREREPELYGLLSDDERQQAEAVVSADPRSTFIASRALIRLHLSEQRGRGTAPWEWNLGRTELGKPTVLTAEAADLDFSISHTGGVIVVAESDRHSVGVDIEETDRYGAGEIPWSMLSSDERQLLRASPADQRPALFLRMWTMKEAFAKAVGLGTELAFEQLSVSFDPLTVRRQGSADPTPDLSCWQVQCTVASQTYWLALVTVARQAGARPNQLVAPFPYAC